MESTVQMSTLVSPVSFSAQKEMKSSIRVRGRVEGGRIFELSLREGSGEELFFSRGKN